MEGGGVMRVPSLDIKLSKAEILRGIVCEKLNTAAQEILAVVERIVSGYEEEAAALRQEIDRQKNQLEAVLQPRVSLCRIEPAREEGHTGGEVPPDKTVQTNGENSASWAGLKHEGGEDVEDKELEKNEGGAINLQVCLLQDAHADMLTRNVFKSSVQEMTCPPDLKEAEFLDLLRSTFPQLSAEFEVFTVDVTRKLTSLNLETMTPKNIEAAVKSRGNGRSALYIRVKVRYTIRQFPCEDFVSQRSTVELFQAAKESQSSPEEPPSSEMNDKTKDDATNDEDRSHASPVERAESRRQKTKPKGDFEHGQTSEDFSAPDPACGAADGDDGVDVDDGDEEWKPEYNDKETKSTKPKRNPRKTKKKMHSIVRRRRRKLEVSAENSPLSCKVCQALSGSNNMLIKHSWSHVDDPERLCGVCGEHSESPEELRSHLNGHKKTYSCDVCGKNLISRNGLQRHAILHTGEKPYSCEVCDKSFVCFGSLKIHRWEHVGGKPYKCDVCNRSFASEQLARVHQRRHTGEKPYTCDVCGKSFADLRGLSRHKVIHSAERRHACQVCGKRFVTPFKLKEHERIHSARVKTFLCDVCCKAFYTAGELTVHLRSHSEEKVMCGVCGKGLSSKGALKRHLTVHTGEKAYECTVCRQTFKRASGLRFHMMIHSGVKAFVCSVCGKAFSRKEYLMVHMRMHNGEKPYKCTICDKGFTQSHCVKTHMKQHHGEQEDG